MSGQELLRAELGRRVRWAAAGPDRPPPEPSVEVDAEAAERAAPDLSAVAVLRRFDPVIFARAAVEFALTVEGDRRVGWFRAFTRTAFLVGNPANLDTRFRGDHQSADRSTMWFAPAPEATTVGLRRLLKRFDSPTAPTPPPRLTVQVPGAGSDAEHHLQVATAGITVTDYLIHVNHILAESVLTRVVRPGDRLVLTHVPRIGGLSTPYSMLRVHRDTADPARLRAYAVLRPALRDREDAA
jgi:hypothetical protein